MAGVLADIVVIFHFAFVVFVVLGGLLALKWRRLALVHIPAAVWGVLIEMFGWVCPLTPLEKRLRDAAEQVSYSDSFVQHYLWSLLYPDELTRSLQLSLGIGVILVNCAIYAVVIHKMTARRPRA